MIAIDILSLKNDLKSPTSIDILKIDQIAYLQGL
jgi:hypothetical protein